MRPRGRGGRAVAEARATCSPARVCPAGAPRRWAPKRAVWARTCRAPYTRPTRTSRSPCRAQAASSAWSRQPAPAKQRSEAGSVGSTTRVWCREALFPPPSAQKTPGASRHGGVPRQRRATRAARCHQTHGREAARAGSPAAHTTEPAGRTCMMAQPCSSSMTSGGAFMAQMAGERRENEACLVAALRQRVLRRVRPRSPRDGCRRRSSAPRHALLAVISLRKCPRVALPQAPHTRAGRSHLK